MRLIQPTLSLAPLFTLLMAAGSGCLGGPFPSFSDGGAVMPDGGDGDGDGDDDGGMLDGGDGDGDGGMLGGGDGGIVDGGNGDPCEAAELFTIARTSAGQDSLVVDVIVDPTVANAVACSVDSATVWVVPKLTDNHVLGDGDGIAPAGAVWLTPTTHTVESLTVGLVNIAVYGDLDLVDGDTPLTTVVGASSFSWPGHGESFHTLQLDKGARLEGVLVRPTVDNDGATYVALRIVGADDGNDTPATLRNVVVEGGSVGLLLQDHINVEVEGDLTLKEGTLHALDEGLRFDDGYNRAFSWLGSGSINTTGSPIVSYDTGGNAIITVGDVNGSTGVTLRSNAPLVDVCAAGGSSCLASWELNRLVLNTTALQGPQVRVGPGFRGAVTLDTLNVVAPGVRPLLELAAPGGGLSAYEVYNTSVQDGAPLVCGTDGDIVVHPAPAPADVDAVVTLDPIDDSSDEGVQRRCHTQQPPMPSYFDNAPNLVDSIESNGERIPPPNARVCEADDRCVPGGLALFIETGVEFCAGLELESPNGRSPLGFTCVERVTHDNVQNEDVREALFVSVGLNPGFGMIDLINAVDGSMAVFDYDVVRRINPTTTELLVSGQRPFSDDVVQLVTNPPAEATLTEGVIYVYNNPNPTGGLPTNWTTAAAILAAPSAGPIQQMSDVQMQSASWFEGDIDFLGGNASVVLEAPGAVLSRTNIQQSQSDLVQVTGNGTLVREVRGAAGDGAGILVSGAYHTLTRSHLSSVVYGLELSTNAISDITATRLFLSGIGAEGFRKQSGDLLRGSFLGITVDGGGTGINASGYLEDVVFSNVLLARISSRAFSFQGSGEVVVSDSVALTAMPISAANNGLVVKLRGKFGRGTSTNCSFISGYLTGACEASDDDLSFTIIPQASVPTTDGAFVPPPAVNLTGSSVFEQGLFFDYDHIVGVIADSGSGRCLSTGTCQAKAYMLNPATMPNPLLGATGLPNQMPLIPLLAINSGDLSKGMHRGLFEIVDDIVGNNDGRCEPGERCIRAPHIGAWQDEMPGYPTLHGPEVLVVNAQEPMLIYGH